MKDLVPLLDDEGDEEEPKKTAEDETKSSNIFSFAVSCIFDVILFVVGQSVTVEGLPEVVPDCATLLRAGVVMSVVDGTVLIQAVKVSLETGSSIGFTKV